MAVRQNWRKSTDRNERDLNVTNGRCPTRAT
jgi:hypothetical protein